jgi:tetratricopeptide (TPR) repeat protein
MSLPKQPPLTQSPGDLPWLAAGLAGTAAIACLLVGGMGQSSSAPSPFVWLDVALVQFASAVPLGVLLGAAVRRRATPAVCLSIAAIAVFLSVVLMLLVSPATQSLAPHAQRAAPALGFALAAALSWLATRRAPTPPSAAHLAIAAAAVLFVPPLYIQARAQSDLRRLGEQLEQMRLGEAQVLVQNLARLDPALQFDGRPIGEVALRIDRAVDDVAARALVPLPHDVNDEQLLARARDLAMLNFTDQAVAAIDAADRLHPSAAAANLRGAIQATRGEWSAGLAAYGRARQLHKQGGAGEPAELIQAVTGIAFCQRKLGNNPAAAAAYAELVALSPTADSHFLLAQFYDDTQQAALAGQHARQAMALDPARYTQRGSKLIDKLRTTQFSCWAIGSDHGRQ